MLACLAAIELSAILKADCACAGMTVLLSFTTTGASLNSTAYDIRPSRRNCAADAPLSSSLSRLSSVNCTSVSPRAVAAARSLRT